MKEKIRLGITTRVTNNDEYRDCLSQDWAIYFDTVLPEIQWMMLPNVGKNIKDYIHKWDINAFIISGGNSLGENTKRDKTETLIIEYAKQNNLPLLGVCRGLQIIVQYFGGYLVEAECEEHPVGIHSIKHLSAPYNYKLNFPKEVNSFHSCLIKNSGKLTPFIFDNNENIEGAFSQKHRILGIGWHPERPSPSADFDTKLIRKFFLNNP